MALKDWYKFDSYQQGGRTIRVDFINKKRLYIRMDNIRDGWKVYVGEYYSKPIFDGGYYKEALVKAKQYMRTH